MQFVTKFQCHFFFTEIRGEKNPKIHMELQKIPTSQSIPKKEEQSWRQHNS
jgi:hypothetical protein